jgi:hypothetical protein
LFARKNGDELATVYRLKAGDASTSNGSSVFLINFLIFNLFLRAVMSV